MSDTQEEVRRKSESDAPTHAAGPSSSNSNNKEKGKQPEVMDTMFVGWVPGTQNEPRKTAPRLHHKKSRTGCQQCRARRVKVCSSFIRSFCLIRSRFRSRDISTHPHVNNLRICFFFISSIIEEL